MSGSPPAAIWGNITCALMLLPAASLNFANTTIAIGNRRLREMGVRKVMGGTLRQLRIQLLGEAFIVCLSALVLGMILVFPMGVDGFNAMWKHLDIKITYLNNLPMLAFLAGAVIFIEGRRRSRPAKRPLARRARRWFQLAWVRN